MEKPEELLPEYLNKDFLETAIQNYKHDKTIEIVKYFKKEGFTEHFASSMFQVEVKFRSRKYPKLEEETLNVVIKAKPVNDGLKMSVVAGGPLFETEIEMYTKTIPAINQLFQQCGMKVELAPELIYATNIPFPVIILKDLGPEGYFAPRMPAADIEDSKLIIQRLAQFHAASFYLSETKEHDFSNYNYTIYSNDVVIETFFRDTLEAFREILITWEGYEDFIPRFDAFKEHVGEIGIKCYTANKPEDGYNVLNHGDFHLRNILFKMNSENRLEAFRFIDYQISVYCSPAIDLAYVFGIIMRDENGNVPMNDLIVFYHEEFVKTLKAFGYMKTLPSLLDLNIELLKHGQITILLKVCFIPFAFVDWSTMKVEDMMATDGDKAKEFKKKLFEIPAVKTLLQNEMKEWMYKGWF
ncbi:CLUMA_CG014162, isoform A [Clunio marinus]|uniref:CLUMA_CG014162, isoform A n=1 Tax=Clunio marinus TaxID=568069 RepID=A0A1J1IL80_9DIPT|nr:CLUMA_CG014162, isoform A [Clunio marinus]